MLPDHLNFHGKKLCGRSFRGRDLRGADFSGADIRGANFSNANLENASFDSVKAGLDPRWGYILNKTSSLLLLFYYSSYMFNWIFFPLIFLIEGNPIYTFIILLVADMFPTGWIASYSELFSALNFRVVSISIIIVLILLDLLPKNQAIAIVIYLIFSLIIHSTGSLKAVIKAYVLEDVEEPRWISMISNVITPLIFIVIIIGVPVILFKLFDPSFTTQVQTKFESMLTSLSTQAPQIILPILTKFDSEKILINFIKSIQEASQRSTQLEGWFIVYFLFSLLPFGAITVWYFVDYDRAEKELNLYQYFTSGSTNFQGANLTNTDFHNSILTSTNFRGANLTSCNFTESTLKGVVLERANLTHVIWLNAKGLDKALMRGTFLEDKIVRQIVVSRNIEKSKYLTNKNLADLNLIGMDLKDVDFTDSDLSGAVLRNADLKKANLTKAILNRVDFTNADLSDVDLTGASVKGAKFDKAILTGAILDDWKGDSNTRLWNVVCNYINVRVNASYGSYIQVRHLEKGELANSFSTNTKLVSLPFHDKVNWKAFNYALYKFQDENNFVLQVIQQGQSITDDVTTVTIAIPDQVDESGFRNVFYESYQLAYNSIKAQASPELSEVYKTLKETISHQGQDYKEIVKLLQKPRTVTYQVETMNQINDQSRKVEVHGNITGSTINLGEISGEVSNAVNQLPDSTSSTQLGIKELLTQLQKAIEEETQLPLEDKADLLEQVKALAEVPKTADQEKKEGLVRKAKKIFNATLKGLPDTAKVAEACSKLLPLILKTLGFPV